MLECEGYKMFQGEMKITPKNTAFPPRVIFGTWLYRPDTGCWYCGGWSYPADVCTVGDKENGNDNG